MDFILTGLIVLFMIGITLAGVTKDENAQWMSIPYTTALKGVACVVVVLVHIPVEYSNKLQDMLGSFAYVAVTIFAMISAYGCRLGIDKNIDYLKKFWKNRSINLMLPLLVFNVFDNLFKMYNNQKVKFQFNQYVLAILSAYFIFWIIWSIKKIPLKYKDFIVSSVIIICSLITYLTCWDIFFGWPVEMLGFVIGLLVYNKQHDIIKYIRIYERKLQAFLCVLALILGCVYIKYKSIYFYGAYLIRIVLAIVIISFIFSITCKISVKKESILFELGKISYEIFLIHSFVISVVKQKLPMLSSGCFICIVMVCSILLSIITNKITKKIKKMIPS